MINIPQLEIDRDGDDPDTLVTLEQDGQGWGTQRVSLHPIQVRLLAERMGVMAPSPEADRTIRRLCRQMHTMRARMQQLDDWLRRTREYVREAEDMDQDLQYSDASLDLVAEFCRELPYDEGGDPVQHQSTALVSTQPSTNPPKGGAIDGGNPPKSGGATGQLPLDGGGP